MPLQANKKVPFPLTSVPSFVFGSPTAPLPDEPIILDPERPNDRFLTLHSYRRWSQCLAKGLRSNGLQNGDRVLFISGNNIAWPIPYMGTLMAGGILTGVSPDLPVDALLRLAKGLEPKFILAIEKAVLNACGIAKALDLSNDKVYLFDGESLFANTMPNSGTPSPAYRHWQELLDSTGEPLDWTRYFSSPDQLAVINYTSGSTGFSKGVMVSHQNIVATAVQYTEHQKEDPIGPEAGASVNWVMWLPFFHAIGQNQYCVIAPKRGIRNYIMDKLALDPLLRYAEKYKPVLMFLTPPLLITMLSHPVARKYDLSSIRTVAVGGAPLRLSVMERFRSLMPNPLCRVTGGWGMTELTLAVMGRRPTDQSVSPSIGELMPNAEAKITTPDGVTELVGPHRPGELWVRSPSVAKGYWRNPDRTAAVFMPDGWLRTGDFAYYDEQKHFYVIDRIQDIIFPAAAPGTYILPTDLESALLSIPGVVDVGVTSVWLDGGAEAVPRGFVVLDEAKGSTAESVMGAFNEKVQPHQRLTGGLYVVTEVPKMTAGKINRVALRDMKVQDSGEAMGL